MSILERNINGWHISISMDDEYFVCDPQGVIRYGPCDDREADNKLDELALAHLKGKKALREGEGDDDG